MTIEQKSQPLPPLPLRSKTTPKQLNIMTLLPWRTKKQPSRVQRVMRNKLASMQRLRKAILCKLVSTVTLPARKLLPLRQQ